MARYILPLHEVTRADVGRVGTKAAALGELARAGFAVPAGFVLTVEAWDHFVAASHPGDATVPEADPAQGGVALHSRVPPDLIAALYAAAAPFGLAPLAVRSSGVDEDLPQASFAGQYETVLDVCGPAALLAAVQRCWSSALSARVTTYRRRRLAAGGGALGTTRVALLVQCLVPAEAAGVAFTANPLSGERAEVLVSAVRGRGDRLTSGQVSPDEWLVRGGAARCRRAPEHAIDAAQVRAVAVLARRVEAHFGCPQDVEWALAGGWVYVLQARPITALPKSPPLHETTQRGPAPRPHRRGLRRHRASYDAVVPPAGFWQREASHYPQPLSPLTRSTLLRSQNVGLRRVFRDMSLPMEGIELREIGGWVYLRRVWLGDRPLPPAWLMPLLIRLVPALRARVEGCVRAVRQDRAGHYIRSWETLWRGQLVARMSGLRAVDLAPLSDAALDAHVGELLALMDEATAIHFYVHGGLCLALADLAFTCRDLFGWDDARSFTLLSGLSETSSAPARGLADLARLVRERPRLATLLDSGDAPAPERLAAVDSEFAAAFAAYQEAYGHRTLRYEVAEPTLAERPALTLALIRDQLARGYDPAAQAQAVAQQRQSAVDAARRLLVGRPAAQRTRFERALAAAERAYPVREESAFYTVGVLLALLRRAVLELGRRLAQRAQIGACDDVFFLELSQARTLLRSGGNGRALVTRRRAERRYALAHPGPPSYGHDPGTPPLDALPPAARFAMAALLFTVDRILALEQTGPRRADAPARSDSLAGIAAAPGAYTGPVHIIQTEAQLDRLVPGDVLVCPSLSPMWSVLFASIGALVTDTGGALSHAAIIAREYGVPAVLATGAATRLLRDGQIVTVDGSAGTVQVAPPVVSYPAYGPSGPA